MKTIERLKAYGNGFFYSAQTLIAFSFLEFCFISILITKYGDERVRNLIIDIYIYIYIYII